MAWDDEIPIIVRALLQDKSADLNSQEYSDDNIVEMSRVMALTLSLTRKWTNVYRINLDNEILSPDPTMIEFRDDVFVMAAAYKTVVAFINAEIRTGLGQVIRIKDGDSELGFSRDSNTINTMLSAFEKDLEDLLLRYDRGQYSGMAVISSHRFNFGGRCEWPNN